MKEMLKNKWMIGFMVIVLSITYMNGTKERKLIETHQEQINGEIVLVTK